MKHLGDITKINGAEIEPVWAIIGGSPCQDLSVAGKRAGLAGARSGLFMEQIRVIKEMRQHERDTGRTNEFIRPRYMVWENVPGAFSSNKGEDFRAVLEETARIADGNADVPQPPNGKWSNAGCIMGNGWSIAWRVHDAQFWGVPQRRRRISLVADFGGQSAPEILFERKGVSGDIAESGETRERVAADAERGFGETIAWTYRGRENGCNVEYQSNVAYALRNPSGGGSQPLICLQGNCIDRAYAIRMREGCAGGGKGPLIQTDKSGTLGTSNDQTVFAFAQNQRNEVRDLHDVAGSLAAEPGMKQQTYVAAFSGGQGEKAGGIGYEEEVSPSLKAANSGSNRTPCICIQGNCIDRADTAGCNGKGWTEDVSYTLNTIDRPAVYDARGNGDGATSPTLTGDHQNRVTDYTAICVGNGQANQSVDDKAGALNCMHDQMAVMIAAVDCRNGTENPDVNGTLQAKEQGQNLNSNNVVRSNMTVRRLTPLECERLQGYPDGWTLIGNPTITTVEDFDEDTGEQIGTHEETVFSYTGENGRRVKCSDSTRYKALGNSIALPFWRWTLTRMSTYLPPDATLGSLFDGIGGFPLIWEEIHGKGSARWASEIEKFPIAVTKYHFGRAYE